jgi:hypothetical protein
MAQGYQPADSREADFLAVIPKHYRGKNWMMLLKEAWQTAVQFAGLPGEMT